MTVGPQRPNFLRVLQIVKSQILRIPTVFIILWCLTLWWGERLAFQRTVEKCVWDRWEQWPSQAKPYHVLLVADPQLVDPHTYPGRPWPLSTLTTLYTDLYLRRTYAYLQDYVRPDGTIFLGDLFDGGREWSTPQSRSPEQRYRSYGQNFWFKEYLRFSKIFLRSWYDYRAVGQSKDWNRKIISSLPGNHDLGFASGIHPAVRNRFDAFFGPLNRIDILGNHSFVSLDTVSLSAMDQVDPKTGSSGAGDGSAAATRSTYIWMPVEDFLIEAKRTRSRAIDQDFRGLINASSRLALGLEPAKFSPHPKLLPHAVREVQEVNNHLSPIPSAQYPTIILTHVPLFRAAETTCGPYRERGSAIPISAGYQYQNVLTPTVSRDIVNHLTPEEIVMIYSGDDHDYCEIQHTEFTGSIREITVKSTSWAMGIRKPGVQLVSLWNPIDVEKIKSGHELPHPKNTVQNHLCLLPDQLGIFIRYGQLLIFTIIALTLQAIRYNPGKAQPTDLYSNSEPLLPISRDEDKRDHTTTSVSPSSSCNVHNQHLSTTTRKIGTYGNLPSSSRTSSPNKLSISPIRRTSSPSQSVHTTYESDLDNNEDEYGMPRHQKRGRRNESIRSKSKLQEFKSTVWQVLWPVFLFYFWLLYLG